MKHPIYYKVNLKRLKGMTLVELMIGLVIAMILLAGVAEIFLGSKQTYRYQEGMARLQENGRYTMDTLSAKIRMAGYTGCFSMDTGNLVNTVENGNVEFDFSKPIIAWQANTSSYENNKDATTYAAEIPDDIRDLISGTPAGTAYSDIIVFTGADNSGIRLASAMPNSSADLKVIKHDSGTLNTGDILLVSDCQKSAIFLATNVTYPVGGGTGVTVNVVHNTGGPPGSTSNSTTDLTGGNGTFDDDASLYKLAKIHYFIAPSEIGNNRGDTVMALWKKYNNNDPEEMVAGVSNMQISLGEDYDADKSADRYGDANLVDFENVTSVRLEIDSDTVERINNKSSISDAIRTQTFVQTISVRNRSI